MLSLLRRRDAWFLEQMNSQLENDCYEWARLREMDGPAAALRSPLLPLTKMPRLVLLFRQGKNVALYSSSGDFLRSRGAQRAAVLKD